MKRNNFVKKIIAMVMATSLLMTTTVISVSAANVYFAFNLGNTGTTYKIYTGGSNIKVYSGDPASVRAQTNNAPGYGMAFRMHYKGLTGYKSATVASPAYWISGAGITHPAYASGQNIINRSYYVGARIDNDYNGTYTCSGYFNSDYVG